VRKRSHHIFMTRVKEETGSSPEIGIDEHSHPQIRDPPNRYVRGEQWVRIPNLTRLVTDSAFSGRPTREKKDRITTDDILASLTRQTELKQKLGKEDHVALEEIAETEDVSRFQGFNPEPESSTMVERKTDYGHLVFVFMLLIGLTVVWLYNSPSKPFDLTPLNRVLQKSDVQSIFANLSQLGIIALAALVGALWIRRKRRGSSQQFLSL